MKKLLFFGLLSLCGWKIYEDQFSQPSPKQTTVFTMSNGPTMSLSATRPADIQAPSLITSPPQFHCDGRVYCSQMNSRDEAIFFINNCPNTKMDGDHDGSPCEGDTRFNN